MNFGENVQESAEVVGGGWAADDSHLAKVMLIQAYFTETRNGSTVMNLTTEDKEKNQRNYSLIITNKKGDTFYTCKKTGDKKMMPNYQIANSICYATTGKSFQECYKSCKKKVVDIMDWESRKELPTEVLTMPTILKKVFQMGVIKVISNKFKNGKETNEKRETNEIHMVFNKDGFTSTEAREGATETKNLDKWTKYWVEPNRVKDTFKEVEEDDEMDMSEGEDPFGTASESDSDDSSDDDAKPSAPEPTDEDEEDPFGD